MTSLTDEAMAILEEHGMDLREEHGGFWALKDAVELHRGVQHVKPILPNGWGDVVYMAKMVPWEDSYSTLPSLPSSRLSLWRLLGDEDSVVSFIVGDHTATLKVEVLPLLRVLFTKTGENVQGLAWLHRWFKLLGVLCKGTDLPYLRKKIKLTIDTAVEPKPVHHYSVFVWSSIVLHYQLQVSSLLNLPCTQELPYVMYSNVAVPLRFWADFFTVHSEELGTIGGDHIPCTEANVRKVLSTVLAPHDVETVATPVTLFLAGVPAHTWLTIADIPLPPNNPSAAEEQNAELVDQSGAEGPIVPKGYRACPHCGNPVHIRLTKCGACGAILRGHAGAGGAGLRALSATHKKKIKTFIKKLSAEGISTFLVCGCSGLQLQPKDSLPDDSWFVHTAGPNASMLTDLLQENNELVRRLFSSRLKRMNTIVEAAPVGDGSGQQVLPEDSVEELRQLGFSEHDIRFFNEKSITASALSVLSYEELRAMKMPEVPSRALAALNNVSRRV